MIEGDDISFNYSDVFEAVAREAEKNRMEYLPLVTNNKRNKGIQIYLSQDNKYIRYSDLVGKEGEDFIRRCYKKILQRDPDDIELNTYLKLLGKGKITKDDLILLLRFSPEGVEKSVYIFDICPRAFHANRLTVLSGEEFVENAYLWILGRKADREGLDNYCRLLKENKISKEEIIYNLNSSIEGKMLNVTIIGISELRIIKKLQRKLLHKS